MFGAHATTRGDRVHGAVMLTGVLLMCAYWVAFYLSDVTKPNVTAIDPTDPAAFLRVYMGFESAFPLADGFVAVSASLAIFYLAAKDAKAVLFGLVASGALMFLGLIDIYFNVLNGLYRPSRLWMDFGLQMEAAINVTCVLLSVVSVIRFWSHPLRRA
ncbi:MAG: hypothetical protein JO111_11985 [Caulobacteraceae bacterium]|nr:hypothetical protein [Caulobacteraceae bacterium]